MQGIPIDPPKPHDPFLQVLLEKGLIEGLRELSAIDAEILVGYLASPDGQEAFNVQAAVIAFQGRGHDFVRGLVIGIATGILSDPDVVWRDVRGGLAILANDGVDVLTGDFKSALEALNQDKTDEEKDAEAKTHGENRRGIVESIVIYDEITGNEDKNDGIQ